MRMTAGTAGAVGGWGRPSITTAGVLALAATGGALAWSWPWAALGLALAGPLILLLVRAAARHPGPGLALLMALVLLQDPLVEAGLTPLQMADEALVLLLSLGLLAAALGRGCLSRSPLDLPTLAFLAAALLSALWREVPPWIAGLGTLSLLKGLLAYHLAARLPHPRRALARGLPWLLLPVLAAALLALAQRLFGAPVYAALGRLDYHQLWQGGKAPSFYFNHNALGHVLVLAGLLCLALALAGSRRARPIALLCLAALVVSASRESWLAVVAGLLALALRQRSGRSLVLAALVGGGLALGGGAVYLGSPLLREELARRSAGVWEGWRLYRMGYDGWGYRGEYRVYNLLKSWDIFLDQPFLGTGPGRFGGATAVRYPSPVYQDYDFLPLDGRYIPLDVFWSRLLTEFGLLGAAAYLACLAAVGRQTWRAAVGRRPLARALGLAAWTGLAAIIVLGCLSPALEDSLSALPFWTLCGLSWSLARVAAPTRRRGLPEPATAPTPGLGDAPPARTAT